ncbi:unnamed protein product [Microthlaspi erraticum]|uniref:F-box domain-containing protein n=1 Tax=Microthlaspi erraticum TaxID=1685480 RepID=A0A6D2IT52_9BRAS|nr:unnamed protein product [Microthlaspi erraticum]
MSSKKQRCMSMEPLPHDVVELIMERLPVKSLLRFRAVSTQWKSTIGDPYFEEKQLKHRQKSGDPDVLMVSVRPYDVVKPDIEALRTLVVGSSSSGNIPTPWENTLYHVSNGSCDGLVCVYNNHITGFVVNPTTGWHRPLPLCQFQQLMIDLGDRYLDLGHSYFSLGFGKDKLTRTYKPVWLYNSPETGLEDATRCEVFDFTTSSWRYVTPAAPYRVVALPKPVHALQENMAFSNGYNRSFAVGNS